MPFNTLLYVFLFALVGSFVGELSRKIMDSRNDNSLTKYSNLSDRNTVLLFATSVLFDVVVSVVVVSFIMYFTELSIYMYALLAALISYVDMLSVHQEFLIDKLFRRIFGDDD